MLPAMAAKPQIAIVGPGRLGWALSIELRRAGYRVREIVARSSPGSQRRARALARLTRGCRVSSMSTHLEADLVWFCVPDREIARAAGQMAMHGDWKGKVALHSSGALSSEELRVLRRRGAAVASVHPLMTFVRGAVPSLGGVPFGAEGDPAAVRVARSIVRTLGGYLFTIPRNRKAAYHAWGAFLSPLLVSLLVTGEEVAGAAGFSKSEARRAMGPIVGQTIANYAKLGPSQSFSGPIVRGDVETIGKHLRILQKLPGAREVYVALARAALRHLPAGNRKALSKQLKP